MSLTCSIAGNSVNVSAISSPDIIDQKTICTITVIDAAGTAFYERGQPVAITDSILGTIFTGVVHSPAMTLLYPNAGKSWVIDCVQRGDYLSGKRTSNRSYANQYAGPIVVDQVQRYGSAEGLSANAALRWDETQGDWTSGTLSNTVGTTHASNGNAGAGDLELSLAGVTEVISLQTTSDFSGGTLTNTVAANNTLMPVSTPAIKIQGTQSLAGTGNFYTYVKIWSGAYALTVQNYVTYDIWIDPSSPESKIGLDLVCSDGTTWRDAANTGVYWDTQYIPPAPATDLSGLADTGQWYHRSFGLPWASGKTISYFTVAIEGDKPGSYTGWIKNISLVVAGGGATTPIFNGTLQTKQQMQNNGYSAVSVGVINTYAIPMATPLNESSTAVSPSSMITNAVSIATVGILLSSYLSYQALIPVGTLLQVGWSLDGIVFFACSNNAPLPSLLAGTSLAGKSIYLQFQFLLDPAASPLASPEITPVLSLVEMTLSPSYTATKSDVLFECGTAANWTSGATLTNTVANSKILTLNGATRNWDDQSISLGSGIITGQTLFSVNAQPFVDDKVFIINVTASDDARSRLDFAPQLANFTAEVDINVAAASVYAAGMVYRTTGWQNANNTYAYSVTVTTTGILLGKGSNTATGAGTFTSISSVTIALTSGNWHRLKVVVSGTTHQIYLDDILFITAVDSTYTAAGYIGLRVVNGSTTVGASASFDNFGIMAALSGTWVSPAISLAAATAYGNSLLSYRDQRQDSTNNTIKVESSLNGGSTWSAYTNTSLGTTSLPLQGLTSGQSLTGVAVSFRITLTTTTATVMPGIDNFRMLLLGQFNSVGTRVSTAMPLAVVSRADTALVNWNANTPAGTSLAVATSINGGSTWQAVATPGAAISGISTQPDPNEDTFTANSSANYTQATFGGTVGAWTWDTTNSRLVGSGGVNGTLTVLAALTFADNQVQAVLDQCDGSGLLANYTVSTSGYYVQIWDSAGTSIQNQVKLFKRSASVNTQVGSTATIAFTRGAPHLFKLNVSAGGITVSMDGTAIIAYVDASPLGSGNTGLLLNTLARVYSLRILQYGQNVSTLSLLTKLTLTSTNPTATPQVLDMQAFVSGPDVGAGVLVPSVAYLRTFLSDNISDLNTKSNYWTTWKNDNTILFQHREAMSAPTVLSSLNSQIIAGQVINDVLVDSAEVDNSGDSYRNRQIMRNAIATATFTEIKVGDGSSTSWSVVNPLVSPPTSIVLNGQSMTFGVKGVDTGKQYYYQIGSTSIDQDSSGALLQDLDSLVVVYIGSFSQDIVLDNLSMVGTITQSMMQTIENSGGGSSSGIVEAVLDLSSTPTTVAAATAQGNQLLQRFGNIGRTFKCKTLRSGFAPGQQVSIFVPEANLMNVQMLITEVDVTVTQAPGVAGGLLYAWALTLMEGPNLGNWVQLFMNMLS